MAANGISNRSGADQAGHGAKGAGRHGDAPDWANGLKQLYDDVVDEPIPDTFKDLLAKLGASGSGNDSGASGSEGQA